METRLIEKHKLIVLYYIISLNRAVVPLIQGYEDAGDFTVKARLRTSLHGNLVFYLSLGSVALSGLILLIALNKFWFASLSFYFDH